MSVIIYRRGDRTALTKNFSRYEFDCPCGCGTQMVDPELAEKLQRIREVTGKKIKITSGYRCLKHNQEAGGGTNSRHRYGMAADWRLDDRSLNPVALGILAQAAGFGGIGIYWYAGNAFCHADTRSSKATWLCDAAKHYPSTTYLKFILPTIRRGCTGEPCRNEVPSAAARPDPGRPVWQGHGKRAAQGAGSTQADPGRHLRPSELESYFRGG